MDQSQSRVWCISSEMSGMHRQGSASGSQTHYSGQKGVHGNFREPGGGEKASSAQCQSCLVSV